MKYQAKWGKKGFLVSPSKIVPLESFKTGMSMKNDSKNDTSGKKPTNTRGIETQKITFSTTYLRAAGVDPLAQYNEWCGELGKSYPLYVGGKKFGPAKMELTSVDISDSIVSPSGEFLEIKLSLTLTEDTTSKNTASNRKTTTSSANSSSGSAAEQAKAKYKETVAAKKEAMNATASTSDKADKKPSKGGGSI